MKKKRVLLLSEGFGAGHTQAAHALAVGMRKLDPGVQTRVLELGGFLHPTMASWILSAYRKAVVNRPKLVGIVYRSQYKKSLNRFAQLALHQIFYKQTADVIEQLKPDCIVSTHPIPTAVVARLKRLGLDVPLCTVITDYDLHGTWVYPEVDLFLIPTKEVEQKILRKGIGRSKIEVTGIPVHPNFWEKHDRDEIRRQFALNALPTVMIMGGGWGLTNKDNLYPALTKWRDRLQLIFCLGNNAKAYQRLKENPDFDHPNIHLLGFSHEIDKLMEVSDLLITKPGGMTCTEGLAKGIPMLFYNPIPGQEEENCQYFTRQGYGRAIQSPEDLNQWLRMLAEQYEVFEKRREMYHRTLANYNPQNCSEAILHLLQQTPKQVYSS